MRFGANNSPFELAEFETRLAKVKDRMAKQGLDALIVSDPANMYYLSGYDGWSFYVHQCVVVALDDALPIWIGRGQDVNGARLTTILTDERIFGYADDYVHATDTHPMEFVAGVLADRGLAAKTIGVEADCFYFTARCDAVLRERLPHATISDAGRLVNWVRLVKSPREIEYMKQAARITAVTMARALDKIAVGVRQCDVVAEIQRSQTRGTLDFGGGYPAIVPLLPAGAGASCPHVTWSDAPFEPDAAIVVELAGVRHHYHCPLARTVYLGTPPPDVRATAEVVVEGVAAALAVARPGARAADVHAAWQAVIAGAGVRKDSRCGYSTGIGFPPDWGEGTVSLRGGDETVLAPGMTIHFMPGIWRDNWGVAISETIVVTEAGAEPLCDLPRRLFEKRPRRARKPQQPIVVPTMAVPIEVAPIEVVPTPDPIPEVVPPALLVGGVRRRRRRRPTS